VMSASSSPGFSTIQMGGLAMISTPIFIFGAVTRRIAVLATGKLAEHQLFVGPKCASLLARPIIKVCASALRAHQHRRGQLAIKHADDLCMRFDHRPWRRPRVPLVPAHVPRFTESPHDRNPLFRIFYGLSMHIASPHDAYTNNLITLRFCFDMPRENAFLRLCYTNWSFGPRWDNRTKVLSHALLHTKIHERKTLPIMFQNHYMLSRIMNVLSRNHDIGIICIPLLSCI
jgi:hypothetical protein